MEVKTKRKATMVVGYETVQQVRERQRKILSRRKEAIFVLLGGKECVGCGETDEELLQFDHIHGRDWDVTKVSSTTRLKNYLYEALAGRLQVLCISCNSSKNRPDEIPDETPF